MDIHKIQTLFQNRSVKWSTHCLERMQERDISRSDVVSCVHTIQTLFQNRSCFGERS